MGLMVLALSIGRLLEARKITFVSEATVALFIGMAVGCVVMLFKEAIDPAFYALFPFNPDYYFLFLLPPIIFNAGFNLEVRRCVDSCLLVLLCGLRLLMASARPVRSCTVCMAAPCVWMALLRHVLAACHDTRKLTRALHTFVLGAIPSMSLMRSCQQPSHWSRPLRRTRLPAVQAL